jgi:hypothetical protein
MAQTITIALDAMGGDTGPSVVIGGAAIALERRPDLRFLIYGREESVRPVLEAHPAVRAVSGFHHSEVTVEMGRQAEPGVAKGPVEIVHVARRPGCAGRRGAGRGFGRQYRRADGHGEVLPEAAARHRAARNRRHMADPARGRASSSMSAPRSARIKRFWSTSP